MQNKKWQDAGFSPFRVAVNISQQQFKRHDFIDLIKQVLHSSKLDPRYLELEITESIAMENPDDVIEKLNALRNIGVNVKMQGYVFSRAVPPEELEKMLPMPIK